MALNGISLHEQINKSALLVDFNANICVLRYRCKIVIFIFSWTDRVLLDCLLLTSLSEKTVRFWFLLNDDDKQFIFYITWNNIHKLFIVFSTKMMRLTLVLQKNLHFKMVDIFSGQRFRCLRFYSKPVIRMKDLPLLFLPYDTGRDVQALLSRIPDPGWAISCWLCLWSIVFRHILSPFFRHWNLSCTVSQKSCLFASYDHKSRVIIKYAKHAS